MKGCLSLICIGMLLLGSPSLAADRVASFYTVAGEKGNPYAHNVFVFGEPVDLQLSMVLNRGRLNSPQLHYVVKDWQNRVCDSGTVVPKDFGSVAQAKLRPSVKDLGWYSVEFSLQDRNGDIQIKYVTTSTWHTWDEEPVMTFAIVPLPNSAVNTPFGLDGGISWYSRFSRDRDATSIDNRWRALADLARLVGVGIVRDRIDWPAVNPQPDVFEWGDYDLSASVQEKQGLGILQVFHRAPDWAGPRVPYQSLPNDLLAVYHFGKQAAEQFLGRVIAWQVWNEEDWHFSKDPGDRYAAVLKAAALGLRAGGAEQISFGGLARQPGEFTELLMANEIAPYIDIYSFHTYVDANSPRYREVLHSHLEFIETHGLQDKQIWLTETGLSLVEQGYFTSLAQASGAQAQYLVKAYVQALAEGIDKVFWFSLQHYIPDHISHRQWGMLRADLTPMPAYVALAVLTATLREGHYLGRVATDLDTTLEVFGSSTGQVMVAWSNRPKTLRLPLETGELVVQDLFGGVEPVKKDETSYILQVNSTPCYVLGGDWMMARKATQEIMAKDELASTVVIAPRFPQNSLLGQREGPPIGYLVTATPLSILVDVYNFGPEPATGIVTIDVPGWTTDTPHTQMTLLSQTQETIGVTLVPPQDFKQDQYTLRIEGDFPGNLATSVARLLVNREHSQQWVPLDALTDQLLWRKNPGPGCSVMLGEKFRYIFNQTGQSWSFTQLLFDSSLDLSDYSRIRFIIDSDSKYDYPFRITLWENGGNRYRSSKTYKLVPGRQILEYSLEQLEQPSWQPQNEVRQADLADIGQLGLGFDGYFDQVPVTVSYRVERIELFPKGTQDGK